MADQVSYAALVAVGPGGGEVDRLRDLIAALAHHEPGAATLVIVDDDPTPRDLGQLAAPAGLRLVVVHHRRAQNVVAFTKGKGICSVIMTGLEWIESELDVRFVVKLDTDSLVIAPFRERLVRLLDAHADLGMIGAYRRSPGGGTRDWSPHERPIKTLARHPLLRKLFGRAPVPAEVGSRVRSLALAARRHGYKPGEHCLGGGYALSGVLLSRMRLAGWFADLRIWQYVDLPEDVMVGLHVRACRLGFFDEVDEGGVFGVSHIGLPFPPEELARRGYAIVHAVKNDVIPEATIRAFFADRRRDPPGPFAAQERAT